MERGIFLDPRYDPFSSAQEVDWSRSLAEVVANPRDQLGRFKPNVLLVSELSSEEDVQEFHFETGEISRETGFTGILFEKNRKRKGYRGPGRYSAKNAL